MKKKFSIVLMLILSGAVQVAHADGDSVANGQEQESLSYSGDKYVLCFDGSTDPNCMTEYRACVSRFTNTFLENGKKLGGKDIEESGQINGALEYALRACRDTAAHADLSDEDQRKIIIEEAKKSFINVYSIGA